VHRPRLLKTAGRVWRARAASAWDETAGMSLFDPQQRWPERLMAVFGFVGIALVAFGAGWLVGTTLVWKWFAA
jgi:hypothetical protein